MLVTGGGTGGTADADACACAKQLMLDPCYASRDLYCCATCADNNLSLDLRVSFWTYANITNGPACKMSSLSRKGVLGGMYCMYTARFTLGRSTVNAVTLLRGSPICVVPRPIRDRLRTGCTAAWMLYPIRCSSYRGQWVVDARRWPANHAIILFKASRETHA